MSKEVEKNVPPKVVQSALTTAFVASLIATKSVSLASLSALTAAYLAITSGRTGNCVRSIGSVANNVGEKFISFWTTVDGGEKMSKIISLSLNAAVKAASTIKETQMGLEAEDDLQRILDEAAEAEKEATAAAAELEAFQESLRATEEKEAHEAKQLLEQEVYDMEKVRNEVVKRGRKEKVKEDVERLEADLGSLMKIAAEQAAVEKRIEEEKIAAEQAAEEKRMEEERIAAEKKRMEEERIAAEWAAEEKRMEEERIAAERAEAKKKRLEEERIAAERAAAEKKRIEEERIAAERAAAEAKRIEDERIASDRVAAEEARIAEERRRAEEAERSEQERIASEQAEFEASVNLAKHLDADQEWADALLLEDEKSQWESAGELARNLASKDGAKKTKKKTKKKPPTDSEKNVESAEAEEKQEEVGRLAREAVRLYEEQMKAEKEAINVMKGVEDEFESDTFVMSGEMNYETMTVVELKDALRSRGLKVSGKKAELIDRLKNS